MERVLALWLITRGIVRCWQASLDEAAVEDWEESKQECLLILSEMEIP